MQVQFKATTTSTKYDKRSRRIGISFVLGLLILLLAPSSTLAIVPATPQQQALWHEVLEHYRSLGVPVADVPLYIVGPNEIPQDWGAYTTFIPEQVEPEGWISKTIVSINVENRRYLNVFASFPYGKAKRVLNYWGESEYIVKLLLHEGAHAAQFQSGKIDWLDSVHAEGLADAVALDQFWPFLAKRIHRRMPTIVKNYLGYTPIAPLYQDGSTTLVRRESAKATGTPWWSNVSRRQRLKELYVLPVL